MAQLPEELLQHICSYLRIECSQRSRAEDRLRLSTLSNVSLANKACNRSALPHLYFALDLRNNSFARLRPFLITLVQRPTLRALVQQIHNEFFETQRDVDSGNAEAEAASADVLAQMMSLADAISNTDLRDRIKIGLERSVQDAELALLLSTCQNLRLWETVAVNRMDQTLCLAVVSDGEADGQASHNPPLQYLSEIKVSHWDTEGAVRMPKLQRYFDLPALKTFRGCMMRCDEGSQMTSSRPSVLTRLYLEDCVIDAAGLDNVLQICPSLETLSLHWGSATTGVVELDFLALSAILRKRAQALRNLTLHPGDAEKDRIAPGPLGDLRPLTSLRMLSLPEKVLFGWDLGRLSDKQWLLRTLPVNLRTLRIMQADVESAKALDAQIIAVLCDSTFVDLSTVKINRSDEFTMDVSDIGWDESESNRFWVILKKTGK